MTEEEIYQNMLRPSEFVADLVSSVKPWYHIPEVQLTEMEKKYWGTTQDGRIGSLRVEVLGCVGISKYKSDVSVYLVCGDAAFATDVIHGSRSPMWPQSSRRAACFPIFHAYARLYVGVFDVTKRKKTENDSFCGRVEIGIPSLRPDTEYDVTLPLRVSSFIYDRRPRGVVRLRLSLHWFSERAAVLSYLPAPRNMTSTYHSVDSPSIPCADPKTFRNVAFTIHGQELPGKYTREAFQATMREFTLYHQNLMFLAKQLLHDAVLYVNPLVSVYVFGSWMHCVWSASLRLAPVYFIGFLVLLLLDGYFRHCANRIRTSGYTPVSLTEILLAIANTAQSKQIKPLLAEKRPRRDADESTLDVEPYDHLEFPFSDGNEYKKRTIEETLVERSSSTRRDKQKELQRHERLSLYVKQERSVDDSIDLDTFLRVGDDAAQDNEGKEANKGARF
ncbi:Protein kinase C conserved region 2 [Fragilaria crotonensis]|nr:Protein kinase C conserved region 2 [Fragilaria crotonensis]